MRSNKFWVQKKIGQNDLVLKIGSQQFVFNLPLEFGQIESVTAEIFLIWTNVTMTNVDWKNITKTVGIC